MTRFLLALPILLVPVAARAAVTISVTGSAAGHVTSATTLQSQSMSYSGTNPDPMVAVTYGGSVSYDQGSIVGNVTPKIGVIKGFSGSYQTQTGFSVDYATEISQATVYDGLPIPAGLSNVLFSINPSGSISSPTSAGSGSLAAEFITHFIVSDPVTGTQLLSLHYDNLSTSNVLTGSIVVTGATTLQLQYDFYAFTYDNGISGYDTAQIDYTHTVYFNADDPADPSVQLIGSSGYNYATAAVPEPGTLGCLGVIGTLGLARRRRQR